MNLRPYQQDAIDDVKLAFMNRNRRVLLVAPTGAGKTVMFSYIAKHAALKGNRIAILAHREELLDQISRTLTQFGVDHGFIAARRPVDPTKLVQVCGVHTLKNRAARIAWKSDLIVCDEAHHATAGSWAQILNAYPDARVLGVTATPERLDGAGLGNVFNVMVRGPEIADLIAGGFLSPVKYYCPKTVNTDGMKLRMGDYRHADVDKRVNNSKVTGEAVEWYRKLCDGAPAVAFCASIAHSEHVAETFRAAGYRWTSLDSTMTSEARRVAVVGLGNGSLHGISSCDIISEGFDLPIVSTAILLRPTASLGLYLQQVGRVLRVSPGKTHATIIDHVGNCGSTRSGKWVEKHGFAEDVREWSLEGRIKRDGAAPVRLCEECYAVVPIGAALCPQCGAVKPEPEVKPMPEVDAGELEEVVAERIRKKKAKEEQAQAKTLEELIALGKSRNYRNPAMWAKCILDHRQFKFKKKRNKQEEKSFKYLSSKICFLSITQQEYRERNKKAFLKRQQKQTPETKLKNLEYKKKYKRNALYKEKRNKQLKEKRAIKKIENKEEIEKKRKLKLEAKKAKRKIYFQNLPSEIKKLKYKRDYELRKTKRQHDRSTNSISHPSHASRSS